VTTPSTFPQPEKPSPAAAVSAGRDAHASFFAPVSSKRPIFEDLVDMTAMVDIVFFLLIFFMVTTMQGVYSSIGMPPPNPQKTVSQGRRTITDFERDNDYVVVRIDRDNTIWLEGAEVPSEQDLHIQLRSARQGSAPPKKMLVLGSAEATHGTVVMVLDAGNDVGMNEVQLAVNEEY
jgi:biopolymer transport protein ExbD